MSNAITADDFDRFYHATLQALIYAEGIVDDARRLHLNDTGLPRRDGTPRTITIFSPDGEPREIRLRAGRTATVLMKTGPDETDGRPTVEVTTESFIAVGFMLADELAKLDAMPKEVLCSLQRVTLSPDGCAHLRAMMFAREVLNALHDLTGFDRQQSGHMTIDRPRPSTEAGWHSLAAGIAPVLPRLRDCLVEIDSPKAKALQLVMSDERTKAIGGVGVPIAVGYSPPLNKPEFIKLRTRNGILENSDSEIMRAKRELHAIEVPGSNWRRFRIPLNELRSRQWSYPSEWNPPSS